jgi:eukaryotic-like serine/threonine-protein kinase
MRPVDFAPGDRVDRYVLVQPLGEGGQGSVWRAEDPLAPGQPRAIKLVPLVLARPNDVERVRREARALAKLEHASLVRCHALFEDLKHSALGVVMDFVDGTSLRAAADEPWMTDQHRFAALRHIAHALAYVHREGVVHRDLKLDNVLVRRAFWDAPEKAENIKLVDFGIAKVSDGSHALTAVDTIVGTIAYLSPELLDPSFFKSNGATAAADVFAFGVLAWKLLAGGHPTGLPAGAGIVAYGAAYRMVAGSTERWPANPPPGAWGQLLEHCLRVRASERIADGVALADRCDHAGDFATSRRPEPAEEPADPLAPTAEIAPPRAEPPVSVDRAARAQAATQRQDVVARLQERDGITNDAVVKPLEVDAAPKADTQLSAPLAAPAQASPSKAAPIAIGAIVLALVFSAAAFVFWKPTSDPPRPLLPTATQAPTRSAAPVATAAIAAPEAAAEDAASEAAAESPARPADCSADRPVCECCPSGRDCAPGRCDDDLNPDENWHLRLGGASIDGADIGKSADVELCARIVRTGDRTTCSRMSALDANNAKLLYVTYGDLQGYGVEFELRTDTDAGTRALRAKLKGKLTRLALCEGIEVDQFSAVDSGSAGTAKLLLFLDDPVAPPEKCGRAAPGRSQ